MTAMPMSEKTKMLAGELYNASGRGTGRRAAPRAASAGALQRDRSATIPRPARRCCASCSARSATGPTSSPGFPATTATISASGRSAFINYNCVFLDCAPIEIGDDLQMGAGGAALHGDPSARPRDPRRRARICPADPHRQRRVDRRRGDRVAGGHDRRRVRRRGRQRRHARSAARQCCGRQSGPYHPLARLKRRAIVSERNGDGIPDDRGQKADAAYRGRDFRGRSVAPARQPAIPGSARRADGKPGRSSSATSA